MVCILMTLHVVISVACIDLGFQVKYHFFFYHLLNENAWLFIIYYLMDISDELIHTMYFK